MSRRIRFQPSLPTLCLLAWVGTGAALAQSSQRIPGANTQQNPTPGTSGSGASDSGSSSSGTAVSLGEPGFTTQLFASSRSTLLGDMFGLRSKLYTAGVTVGLAETSEVFGNVTGGVHRGAAYDGLTLMSLGLDTAKAFGLEGGTFNVSAFQIHGRSLAQDNLFNLQTNSGIEAQRSTRLWELWYQQSFLEGKVDIKLGQQSLDQEFIGSSYSGLFINTMMGWPLIPSVDLYAGGPAYPLSSLGIRIRAQPFNNVTVLGGVFDDNPPGGPFNDDSQIRGAEQAGAKFHLKTGALAFAEVQFAINQPALGELDRGGGGGLPGVYKLGGWYDTARFPDQRIGTDGLSLADPASNGNPRFRRSNFSIYGVVDQMVWRPDPEKPQAVGVFARLMGAPGDRNLASFSVNAGITLKAPIPSREDDTVGFGYGLAKISNSAILLDQDTAAFNNGTFPIRSSESFIELTYQAQLAPWLAIQPDFQYVWTPGGGIQNPEKPAKRIGNEAIFGVRTNVTF